MKNKVLATALALCMVISMLPATALAVSGFSDMPNDYSTEALHNAVANGLLGGFDGKIMPNDNLTRSQMAAVIVRAFGAEKAASLDAFKDVVQDAWYYRELSSAVHMGILKGDSATTIRPNDPITRQEAFVVLSRAFSLADGDVSKLEQFSDKASIADWAKSGVSAMVATGFVKGDGTNLNPLANISRKDFAVTMDRMIGTYIKESGTVTTLADGSVMINEPNVTLKGVTVKGNLIIGDGVGDGDVTLDSVKVEGDTVVRGGGVNSFVVKGNSTLGTISIAKIDGNVRVAVEGNAKIEIVEINDGKDDVIIEGNVGTIEVSAATPVKLNNATITEVIISAANADVTVGDGTRVTTVNATEIAANAQLEVVKGATITTVNTAAEGTEISGEGCVEKANVSGNNVKVNTPGTTTKVEEGVSGVTAGNKPIAGGETGKVEGNLPSGGSSSGGSSGGGSQTVYYTVTFKDYNGTTLKTQSVARGYSASAPSDPARGGYTFTGWDEAFDSVTSDLVITALYEKIDDPEEDDNPADDPEEDDNPADDPEEDDNPADDPEEDDNPADDPEESEEADQSTDTSTGNGGSLDSNPT